MLEDSLRRGARSSGRFRGEVTRVWLLQIVHETCVSWTDTKTGSNRAPAIPARTGEKPINAALSGLPMLMREVLVLRELEDLSYADIARIVGVSIETVVSRLALARVSIQVAPSRPSAANVVFPLADASSNAR